jgi:sulfhydrogenase subunit beta (sulfur reductase)
VFLDGGYVDQDYRARREGAFIVAVNCAQAAATCFCVSTDTGPKATAGYDLALTELLDGGSHAFVVEVGSERGAEVLAELAHREAEPAEARI